MAEAINCAAEIGDLDLELHEIREATGARASMDGEGAGGVSASTAEANHLFCERCFCERCFCERCRCERCFCERCRCEGHVGR
jgi:hypothetical protein